MCGIAGFIPTGCAVQVAALDAVRQMCESMRLRGPDSDGFWVGEGVTLGHRRLAILDLDARANQPMVSADGRYTIVFNGEIYNFHELRRELERKRVTFRTTSDTEVLLAMFCLEAERMLPRLRGMFAFAIWDAHTRELFLARDPYGIKPLYYSRTSAGLVFASQVKAIIASGLASMDHEPAGLAGFYLWGSVPEPWTLYRNVFALPAGHWLKVCAGVRDEPVCWHDIRTNWRSGNGQCAPAELQELVRQAVTDSVRAHLVADVPVSVFLSGGIDSSAVAGVALGLGARVKGITIMFEEFAGQKEDESHTAAAIAARYGLPHRVRHVSRAEFDHDVPRIIDAMDQPSIDGVNTWFASKAAAECGYKVALSGVGGDELFCGYSNFRQIPQTVALGRAIASIPAACVLLAAPCSYLAKSRSNPKLAGLPVFMSSLEGMYFLKRGLFLPDELPALMGADNAREALASLNGSPPGMLKAEARDNTSAVGLLESTLYLRNQLLRDSDWASMAHSVELRTPLVDTVLLETLGPFVSRFAERVGKSMLASSTRKKLPESILTRPKVGFSVPMQKWMSRRADQHAWANLPLLAPSRTPWARRWARTVIDAVAGCG